MFLLVFQTPSSKKWIMNEIAKDNHVHNHRNASKHARDRDWFSRGAGPPSPPVRNQATSFILDVHVCLSS